MNTHKPIKNTKMVIGLVDCNNFFVSCERLFRPDLLERPVIVLSSNDGCVISRSNEAKMLGFTMGEPYFKVKKKCTQHGVTVFSSNFALYRDLSRRVMHTLRRFADTVEVYSIDEAFLELEVHDQHIEETTRTIRETIIREIGIPVAVGISTTKTLAKVATHIAKEAQKHEPAVHNGTCILLRPQHIRNALRTIPVREIWGVGFRLAPMLQSAGVNNAADLSVQSDLWVRKRMSIRGVRTVHELQGTPCFLLGEEAVTRKSLLHSQSFGVPVHTLATLSASVAYHARKVAEVLRAEKVVARELSVIVRTKGPARHRHHGLCYTEVLPVHTNDTLTLVPIAHTMLMQLYRPQMSYTKAGILVRDIVPEKSISTQTLFGEATPAHQTLMHTLDALRHTFGDVIHTAAEHAVPTWRARHTMLSPAYTTTWGTVCTVPLP